LVLNTVPITSKPITSKEKAMIRSIRHTVQVAVTSLFLLCAGATAAFAGPAPIEPDFPPPTQSGPSITSVNADTDFSTQLRWMLSGVGLTLAIAAVALTAVLWHRSHATSRRLATP
jgi:hypothetical protein